MPGPRLQYNTGRRRLPGFIVRAFAIVVLCLAAASARAEPFERGLLWRISRPGVAPSHLFGTLHLPDARLQHLPEPVERAFVGSRRFIMEMYPDEFVAARFVEGGQLPPPVSLAGLLEAPVYARLAELLAARGLPETQLARLKPWAALLALTGHRATDGLVTIDNALYIKARFANMRVEELESVEEQIAVFDDVPLPSQLALLEAYVAGHGRLPEMVEATVSAYLRRDLAAIHRARRVIERGAAGLSGHHGVFEKKFVHDRSVVMAHRMQAHLRSGRSFVAVGALHLYGERGILNLLRQDGWRLRRVY